MEALGLTEAMLWEAEYSSLNLTFNLHHRLIKLFSVPLQWRSPRLVANLMGLTIALFSPVIPSLISPSFVPAAIAQTSNCNNVFLEKGDSGAAVTALQEDLKRGGYPNVIVDGIFGSQTDDVLRRFQASSNLTADGIYGSATCQVLTGKIARINPAQQNLLALPDSSLPPLGTYNLNSIDANSNSANVVSSNVSASNRLSITRLLRNGSRGSEVTELQTALRRLGYRNVSIDGVFGPQTEAAVRDFQSKRGIGVDGVVGSNTVREIETALGGGSVAFRESSRYIVVVPLRANVTLATVRGYVPNAQEFDSRRGKFANAGNFDNRDAAESLSYALRSYNLDARVFAP